MWLLRQVIGTHSLINSDRLFTVKITQFVISKFKVWFAKYKGKHSPRDCRRPSPSHGRRRPWRTPAPAHDSSPESWRFSHNDRSTIRLKRAQVHKTTHARNIRTKLERKEHAGRSIGRWETEFARTRVPPIVGSRGMAALRQRPPLRVSPALRRRASQRIKRADIKVIFVPPPATLIVFIRVLLGELSRLPFWIINSNETRRLIRNFLDNDNV